MMKLSDFLAQSVNRNKQPTVFEPADVNMQMSAMLSVQ